MTERIDARGEGVERWRADQWVTSAVAGSASGEWEHAAGDWQWEQWLAAFL